MPKYSCTKCDREFNSYESLRKHVGRIHKIHSTNFFVEYHLDGVWPTCGCGCGEKVKWSHSLKGFTSYKQGHQSRVHNNWGHNKKAIEASAQTRREQFASGERTMWSKGKTVETDPSLQSAAKKLSARFTKKIKKEYSVRMKTMRADGTIPTLYRENSSQWKGGVSSINQLARADKRLYDEWKLPILQRDRFKCTQCPATKDLHIHHNGESFSNIIKKVMTIEDYEKLEEFDRKKDISERVVAYHINHHVSGATLCKDCHKALHPKLNFV